MKLADYIKSSIILNKGMYKNNLTVDEIGLPLEGSTKNFRADIYDINIKENKITIFEVKSSKQDFDLDFKKGKYLNYLLYCDYLYFCVHIDLYKYVNEMLFENTDEINELNRNIGIYIIDDTGLFKCMKKAKKSEFFNLKENEIHSIINKVNIQLKYRYYRFHENRFKEYKNNIFK